MLILAILNDAKWYIYLMYGIAFFLFFIIKLIIPLFRKDKNKTSYSEEFKKNIDDEMLEYSIIGKLFEKYNRYYILFSFLFLMSILILYQIGGAWANNKKEFKIIDRDSTNIVVEIYGDNLILCNTEELKKKDVKKITVINSAPLDNFTLSKYILNLDSKIQVNKSNSHDSTNIEGSDSIKSIMK